MKTKGEVKVTIELQVGSAEEGGTIMDEVAIAIVRTIGELSERFPQLVGMEVGPLGPSVEPS